MTTSTLASRYRGVGFTTLREVTGVWRWKVLPANAQLHAYDFAIASGMSPSREAAEHAARLAIDAQLDS